MNCLPSLAGCNDAGCSHVAQTGLSSKRIVSPSVQQRNSSEKLTANMAWEDGHWIPDGLPFFFLIAGPQLWAYDAITHQTGG